VELYLNSPTTAIIITTIIIITTTTDEKEEAYRNVFHKIRMGNSSEMQLINSFTWRLLIPDEQMKIYICTIKG
jgi:hypothetical protein